MRLSAAELLAGADPESAAPACLAIACDEGVGDEVRLSAAELLAGADQESAAPACLAIACDEGVGDEVRLSAAELLAGADPSAAASACLAIAATGQSATRCAGPPPSSSWSLTAALEPIGIRSRSWPQRTWGCQAVCGSLR